MKYTCTSFNVLGRYFVWNFKGYLWSSMQNISPIHWKIWYLYNIQNICFWKVPPVLPCLNHWGRVTHICVNKLTIIGSDNGLSPHKRQVIIWINAGILLIGPLGTKFSEILIAILRVSFKKMRLKGSSAKWRPFCLGLNVLRYPDIIHGPRSVSFAWCHLTQSKHSLVRLHELGTSIYTHGVEQAFCGGWSQLVFFCVFFVSSLICFKDVYKHTWE